MTGAGKAEVFFNGKSLGEVEITMNRFAAADADALMTHFSGEIEKNKLLRADVERMAEALADLEDENRRLRAGARSVWNREGEFRESLAALMHEIWAHWTKYMLGTGIATASGAMILPPDNVERWYRQIDTPYADLTEKEKGSDRNQADKVLALLHEWAVLGKQGPSVPQADLDVIQEMFSVRGYGYKPEIIVRESGDVQVVGDSSYIRCEHDDDDGHQTLRMQKWAVGGNRYLIAVCLDCGLIHVVKDEEEGVESE